MTQETVFEISVSGEELEAVKSCLKFLAAVPLLKVDGDNCKIKTFNTGIGKAIKLEVPVELYLPGSDKSYSSGTTRKAIVSFDLTDYESW